MAVPLPRTGGTYGVALALDHASRLEVGALGMRDFPEGVYVYVGSAWGPGGLQARVGHHLRGSPKARWHIDTLRAVATPIAVWLAPGQRLECMWAHVLTASPVTEIVVPRFGASDCRCASHLFRIASDELDSLDLPGSTQWLPIGSATSVSDR